MTAVGDFQVIGLRRFGQLQAQNADGDWICTVFDDGKSGCADITLEASVAADNTLVPQAPPSGFAGFGDLVRWTRNTPPGSVAPWPGSSVIATTVLYTEQVGYYDYWVLYLPETGGFVNAFEDEVVLLESALPP